MECAKCGKEVSYPSFYVIDGLVGSGGQIHCPECYRKYLMDIGSVKIEEEHTGPFGAMREP